jgi:hypothetical protein
MVQEQLDFASNDDKVTNKIILWRHLTGLGRTTQIQDHHSLEDLG